MSKKSPQLRFEGFTDDWVQRKLKELFQPSKNKNNNGLYNQKDILAASLGTELIPKRTFFGLKSTRESVKNYRIVKTGDLIYTKSPIKGFPNGIIRSNKGNVGIVPPLYCVYTLQKDINSSIIQLYFEDKNRLDFYLFPLVNVGARNNVNITDLEFLEGKVTIPKSYEEQSKIVQFMEQLNTTIALHQRKLDLLKEQKKGYLQKMFPKNGAKVPELRFAGFADDWEERKLSDVANHRGGTAIEKYFDKDGEYKVISIGSYGLNSQYVDQNIRAISNEITDGRVVNSGELTMVLNDKTANGTIIGRTLLVEKDNEYVINQRTEIISPKENFDSNFAYTILNGPFREKVKRIVQGGTQIYVNYPAVSNLNLELPKIEEQQKIGSFFKQLDDTIALHQRKLDLLKERKKGFLQKMFV